MSPANANAFAAMGSDFSEAIAERKGGAPCKISDVALLQAHNARPMERAAQEQTKRIEKGCLLQAEDGDDGIRACALAKGIDHAAA